MQCSSVHDATAHCTGGAVCDDVARVPTQRDGVETQQSANSEGRQASILDIWLLIFLSLIANAFLPPPPQRTARIHYGEGEQLPALPHLRSSALVCARPRRTYWQ